MRSHVSYAEAWIHILFNFFSFIFCFIIIIIIVVVVVVVVIIVTIIELTHSKTILENTVKIEPQPVVLDFKNLSQYSGRSK